MALDLLAAEASQIRIDGTNNSAELETIVRYYTQLSNDANTELGERGTFDPDRWD